MYTFDSRVRYSECDSDSKLTLTGIVNYLQDCSVAQSDDLGVGIDYLVGHHYGWVVNYWQIDIARRPRLSETITVGTSPYKMAGFFGMRNFAIDAADGERLVTANSVWTLMDIEHYVPTKLPEDMASRYELFPKFDMEYTNRKIRLTEDAEREPAGNVTVTPFDLDSNHHLNNSRYIDWALSAMKAVDSGFDENSIKRLRVEYRHQVLLGQTLELTCCREEGAYTIEMTNEEGDVCCVLQACS